MSNNYKNLQGDFVSNLSAFGAILAQKAQAFSDLTGRAISWLTFVMMLLMTAVVLLRYGFNMGWIAMQESVLYLHAFVLMLGMAHTLSKNEHVRVDIFYRRFTPSKQKWVNIVGHALFLIPTCIFVMVMSWQYVSQSWQILEGSQEAGGLPLVYLLKSLLIVSPFLLVLEAMAQIVLLLTGKPAFAEKEEEAL